MSSTNDMGPSGQAIKAGHRNPWERFRDGGWYFVVVIFSAGILSPVPLWHAWSRLHTRFLLVLSSLYTIAIVLLVYVVPGAPEGDTGSNSSGSVSAGLTVLLAVSACLVLLRPRREVFGLSAPKPSHDDPAVRRVLDGRVRRADARALVENDHHLARELRVGRPDLTRDYDDGGLVDVNSAPAPVIADVCGIDGKWAIEIVEAREARGGIYFHLTELLIDVPLPGHVAERVRERAVFIA